MTRARTKDTISSVGTWASRQYGRTRDTRSASVERTSLACLWLELTLSSERTVASRWNSWTCDTSYQLLRVLTWSALIKWTALTSSWNQLALPLIRTIASWNRTISNTSGICWIDSFCAKSSCQEEKQKKEGFHDEIIMFISCLYSHLGNRISCFFI